MASVHALEQPLSTKNNATTKQCVGTPLCSCWSSAPLSNDEWKKVMNHEKVISLDEMPGWDNYTSAAQVQVDNDVVLYPNPVKDVLMVVAENASVKIIDIAGRTIASASVNGQTSISTKDWNKGVYMAVVTSKQGEGFFKIIK